MALDVADAKKMLAEKPGVTVLGARMINSADESKGMKLTKTLLDLLK
jgi:hypothetical protein